MWSQTSSVLRVSGALAKTSYAKSGVQISSLCWPTINENPISTSVKKVVFATKEKASKNFGAFDL